MLKATDKDSMQIMKTPRTVDIGVTGRCNLRCAYCSHFSGAGDVDKDLPTEEWLKFFEELNRCAVLNVILQGGEPFCRNDIRKLLTGIVRNRMRFSVLSNGTLIDEDVSASLAETGRCDGVQVSIDGSVPITHDVFRGKGTFYRAVRGIRFLQKYKVPVSVRVTIHKKNVRELEKIAALLLEDIRLPHFSTNSAGFMGLCRKNSEMVQLCAEERTVAMQSLVKLNQKYNGRIGGAAGPLADAQNWKAMIHAEKRKEKWGNGGGFLSACNGPFDTIAVRADGVMVPCSQMNHLALGRINTNNLQHVWMNHPTLRRLRMRYTIPLSHFEFCAGCQYSTYCSGNCPALAYQLIGEENHPSPDACLRQFLEAGGKVPG